MHAARLTHKNRKIVSLCVLTRPVWRQQRSRQGSQNCLAPGSVVGSAWVTGFGLDDLKKAVPALPSTFKNYIPVGFLRL